MSSQIFVESTRDEFEKDKFIVEQVTDNDLDNFSSSIFQTSDGIMNVVWTTIGTFSPDSSIQAPVTSIENPLLIARNVDGTFSIKNIVPILDKDSNPLSNIQFPAACYSLDKKGMFLASFKEESTTLTLGLGRFSTFGNASTFIVEDPAVVVEDIEPQRVSIQVGSDSRIMILYTDSSGLLKAKMSADNGLTFDDVGIEDIEVSNPSSTVFSNHINSELTNFSILDGVLKYKIASIDSNSNKSTQITSGAYKPIFGSSSAASVVLEDVEVDPQRVGLWFDKGVNFSLYVALLRDRSSSPNNSNIIVFKTQDRDTYFKLKE